MKRTPTRKAKQPQLQIRLPQGKKPPMRMAPSVRTASRKAADGTSMVAPVNPFQADRSSIPMAEVSKAVGQNPQLVGAIAQLMRTVPQRITAQTPIPSHVLNQAFQNLQLPFNIQGGQIHRATTKPTSLLDKYSQHQAQGGTDANFRYSRRLRIARAILSSGRESSSEYSGERRTQRMAADDSRLFLDFRPIRDEAYDLAGGKDEVLKDGVQFLKGSTAGGPHTGFIEISAAPAKGSMADPGYPYGGGPIKTEKLEKYVPYVMQAIEEAGGKGKVVYSSPIRINIGLEEVDYKGTNWHE